MEKWFFVIQPRTSHRPPSLGARWTPTQKFLINLFPKAPKCHVIFVVRPSHSQARGSRQSPKMIASFHKSILSCQGGDLHRPPTWPDWSNESHFSNIPKIQQPPPTIMWMIIDHLDYIQFKPNQLQSESFTSAATAQHTIWFDFQIQTWGKPSSANSAVFFSWGSNNVCVCAYGSIM